MLLASAIGCRLLIGGFARYRVLEVGEDVEVDSKG